MLSYPNFSEEFIAHTDASAIQFGGVTTQNNKPLSFFSRKLAEARRNFATIQKENYYMSYNY